LNHHLFARVAITAVCCVQGIAQPAIDWNRTHASNPAWTGHSRLHVVWQSVTVSLLSIAALVLIWSDDFGRDTGFYMATVLTCLSPLGFLSACVSRRMYGGTLSDPSGIPPARVVLRGKTYAVDMNLAAVLLALASMAAIVAIYRA
jgi:hypothetical protein